MAYGNVSMETKKMTSASSKGGTHTMPDGTKMTGSTHNSKSKPVKRKQTTKIDLGDGSFKIKEGALSKQLNIPIKDNIPMSLLKKLVKVENGMKFMHQGKSRTMTPLLKRRVSLAITLKSR